MTAPCSVQYITNYFYITPFDPLFIKIRPTSHGMHGMLSDVTYQRLAGTNVLTDFVELPSQLFEHWLSEPEVLKKHVRNGIRHKN